ISPPTEGVGRSIPLDQATEMTGWGNGHWAAARAARWREAGLIVVTLLGATTAHAQYVERSSDIKNRAVTFTGNTLGLRKPTCCTQPVTADGIGPFTTIESARQVGTFPPGTTLAFAQNSASATLNLPAGSTVLYAELTWGGTYGLGGQDVSGSRNNSITL